MPRTYAWRPTTSGLTYVFDIDKNVGANALNRRPDVLLIQWMLAQWMASSKEPELIALIINGKAPTVKVDGICGPKTIGAIRTLEEVNPQVVKDGRVDPLNTINSKASKLQLLNELMSFAGAMKGFVPNSRAGGGIPFPQEIVPELFRP